MNRRYFLSASFALAACAATAGVPLASGQGRRGRRTKSLKFLKFDGVNKVIKTDDEWKKILTPEQYDVARQKGTERPFSSPLNSNHKAGIFECVACGLPLFSSKAKFDSGTGWPSFWQPIAKENVQEETDRSLSQARTEVLCARCESHIGHVFPDGPEPTGLRYCMNGVALKFVDEQS